MLDGLTIAKRLKELRAGQSREQVARECKISLSALGMYEAGRRIPRDEVNARWGQCYKQSVEENFRAQNVTSCAKYVHSRRHSTTKRTKPGP